METVEDTKGNESVWSLHQCRFGNIDCGKQSSYPTQSPEKITLNSVSSKINGPPSLISLTVSADVKHHVYLLINGPFAFTTRAILYIYIYTIDLSVSIFRIVCFFL